MSVTAAVLGLALAIALGGTAAAAPGAERAAEHSDARDAARASTLRQGDHSTQGFVRAASGLTDRQRAAIRRLAVAARNLRRSVDAVVKVPNDADFLKVTQAQFTRAELILAIRNARAVGLGRLARHYQRVLDFQVKRLNESLAFSALLRRASQYGRHVAQKAHEDNPKLSPAVLGNIAVNAANWYSNNALLQTTLRVAKKKSPTVYEITLKKGEDLDRRAYALYRSLSIGSRKTNRSYRGREGLHELPDAKGGFNGGLIGLRRAAESASRSPAIDIKTPDGRLIKIHLRHET